MILDQPSAIQKSFQKTTTFIGYLTGGDGGLEFSIEAGLALIEGGVDILEIGIPFSDPVADGPVIQKACLRALKSGTTPLSILKIAEGIKKYSPQTPLILFSYFNPILQMGPQYLFEVKNAGFDGALIVDLPFEDTYYKQDSTLDFISVVAPSTPAHRMKKIVQNARGFIYYACQKGTTGVHHSIPSDLEANIHQIRKTTSLPIAVGFGISNRSIARNISKVADGIIVGSAFVKKIEEGATSEELKLLARHLDPHSEREFS